MKKKVAEIGEGGSMNKLRAEKRELYKRGIAGCGGKRVGEEAGREEVRGLCEDE
jgi:hypothetical protein